MSVRSRARVVDVVKQELAKGMVGAAVAVVAGSEIGYSAGFGAADTHLPAPISSQTTCLPWLPDRMICRPELADGLLAAVASARRTGL